MTKSFVKSIDFQNLSVWEKIRKKRTPASFDLELTARCNNNCRHCYVNLPPGDENARSREMSYEEIMRIADEAVSLGALWCLVSGGEPLLREDFADIFIGLKQKGLLVSVFTNANLVSDEIAALFREYPPRDIEVTVYGATEETYDAITGRKGAYKSFREGIGKLVDAGVRIRLKAVALRSNFHEFDKVVQFCKEGTKDFFRYDPLIHLRTDGNARRNKLVQLERLTPEQIAELEKMDSIRFDALKQKCDHYIFPDGAVPPNHRIFRCSLGETTFSVSYDGKFRLCSSLSGPEWTYDLRDGSLSEAWNVFAPKIISMESKRDVFLENCHACPVVNLCLWCPANALLETGEPDVPVEYFCEVAKARASVLKEAVKKEQGENS